MTKRRIALLELESIFSTGSELPLRLVAEFGEVEALRIGQRAQRKTTNMVHREKYALACIARTKRIRELEEQIKKRPRLEDILEADELREIPNDVLCARRREARELEDEFAALTGGESGLFALANRVGWKPAGAMFNDLIVFFDKDAEAAERRIDAILLCASKADRPRAYVAGCIVHERAARLARQKNASR